jgi:hypothetical protein
MKVKDFFKKAAFYIVLAFGLGFSFAAGYLTHKINVKNTKEVVNPYNCVKSVNEVSVAVNEKSEMLIINRKDGSYEVYSDSVGQIIFKLYAVPEY